MEIKNIPNQIIKTPLQPLNLKKVDTIALHHMAHPTADIKAVESWHINQGWRAIGYNFWIAFDGAIYRGRGFNLGAGVLDENHHIISVGFQGDFHNVSDPMPDAQFNAGIDIINYIQSNVPTAKKIGGHKDFQATVCPGQYFPLEEMKTLKKRGASMSKEMFKDVPENDYAYNHIKKLLECGIVNGDGEGNFNPDQPITRRDVAIMIANAVTYLGK